MAVLTVDFRKHSGPTPADDMAAQIITDCVNFTLDFKQHEFCASPLFLQTLEPWFPNEMQNLLFIWKEDFGPLSNSPVIFLLNLQLQFTPREALPSVWICFAWQYSQACGHPCCLCKFSYPISSFQSTLHLICFDTALLEQPPFSNGPLWLTLFVEGVNDRLLDHCQVSSVPHYCGFKEQEIPRIYTVWMVIFWNSNVNILIFWETNFWLSLAVSSNHQN